MRRRPGIQGLQKTAAAREKVREIGETVQQANMEIMRTQMATFKTNLEKFAAAHKDDIRKDPDFRQQFHAMCSNIGVDPLVSNKGTWAQILGLGQFYYSLAVTVLDVCWARRAYDGGLSELSLVHKHVVRRRGSNADPISEDDIIRAIKELSVLGGGLGIVNIGGRIFLRSIPAELSTDGNILLEFAFKMGGCYSKTDIARNLGWKMERASDALTQLARGGLVLIDDPPGGGERIYWFPSVPVSAGSLPQRKDVG